MSNFLIVESYNKYFDNGYVVIYESWLDSRFDKEIVGSFFAENQFVASQLFNSWLEGGKVK